MNYCYRLADSISSGCKNERPRSYQRAPQWRVVLGVVLGLVVGKVLGVTLASLASVRFNIAALPEEVGWSQMHGVSWLAGIGFTMSLFIANLAFGSGPLLNSAKIGILAASFLAGIVGWLLLRRSSVIEAE